tara:strand:+ start:479 stop:682 length:204 start_codon:yes stop_codon:yes gene_type:complete
VPQTSEGFDPSKRGEYPSNYVEPEKQNFIDNDAPKAVEKNIAQISGKVRNDFLWHEGLLSHGDQTRF